MIQAVIADCRPAAASEDSGAIALAASTCLEKKHKENEGSCRVDAQKPTLGR